MTSHMHALGVRMCACRCTCTSVRTCVEGFRFCQTHTIPTPYVPNECKSNRRVQRMLRPFKDLQRTDSSGECGRLGFGWWAGFGGRSGRLGFGGRSGRLGFGWWAASCSGRHGFGWWHGSGSSGRLGFGCGLLAWDVVDVRNVAFPERRLCTLNLDCSLVRRERDVGFDADGAP